MAFVDSTFDPSDPDRIISPPPPRDIPGGRAIRKSPAEVASWRVCHFLAPENTEEAQDLLSRWKVEAIRERGDEAADL